MLVSIKIMYGNKINNPRTIVPNNPIQSFNSQYLQNIQLNSNKTNDILSSNIAKCKGRGGHRPGTIRKGESTP